MANYDDRGMREPYRRDDSRQSGYGRDRDGRERERDERQRERDRGPWNRTSDEMRSWFGDEEAERRRRMDEARERSWPQSEPRDYVPGRGSRAASGPHYGKGPRGYRRSDERIREDVCDRLSEAPDVDASEIDVEVTNNEVMLRGSVNTRFEKRRAEDLAEDVAGVNDVRNEIRVTNDRAGATRLDLTGAKTPSAIGETPQVTRNKSTTRSR